MELTQLTPDTPMEVWDTLESDTDTPDLDTDMEDFTTRNRFEISTHIPCKFLRNDLRKIFF